MYPWKLGSYPLPHPSLDRLLVSVLVLVLVSVLVLVLVSVLLLLLLLLLLLQLVSVLMYLVTAGEPHHTQCWRGLGADISQGGLGMVLSGAQLQGQL